MENSEKLLQEIAGKLDRQEKTQRIMLIASVVLAVCVAVITFYVVRLVPTLQETLEEAGALVEEADYLVDQAQGLASDAQALAKDAQSLAKEATDSIGGINKAIPAMEQAAENISNISDSFSEEGLPMLYESLDKIRSIDIETLNESIDSLYGVVNPLASLFGKK